jgi:hypothetical protein
VEKFEDVAESGVTIDDYFQKLYKQLKTGIENLYKIFNFFSNYSTQLNLTSETKEKIDKILKPAI